jgi:uncharacterized protein
MVRALLAAIRGSPMQSAPVPVALTESPINPAWVKEGSPTARAQFLTESADARIKSGVWDCTAGRFIWIFAFDEVVQILEGEVQVEANGQTRVLTAGSTAFFPYGLHTHWHVPKYVKKFFTQRHPSRRLGALLRRGTQLAMLSVALFGLDDGLTAGCL